MPHRFDEDRRNKYARSAQAWLALVAQATQRRTTTYDALGALLLSHPLTLRSDLDPIDDYCNQHGLPPLAVVCVDPKTGSPAGATSASSGWTRTGSGSSTTTGSPWCPRPRRKSRRPTSPRTPGRPPAPRQGREQLPKCQTGADQPRESPGRTDTRGNQWTVSLNSPCPRQIEEKRGESGRHPIAEQSDQWQQPVVAVSHCRTSMTMAQRVPLAFPAIVPQEGWEEVHSRERPRRSPSRRTVSQRRPPSPRCPGGTGYVRTVRPRRAPTRLKARRNPRSRQTEAPALPGGGLRAGSQGPRARARPPPASGAMPCLPGA